jgi:hypothetical protein
MAYTSEYAQNEMSKASGGGGSMKKERKHRAKATKAVLKGKTKKAARHAKKANVKYPYGG